MPVSSIRLFTSNLLSPPSLASVIRERLLSVHHVHCRRSDAIMYEMPDFDMARRQAYLRVWVCCDADAFSPRWAPGYSVAMLKYPISMAYVARYESRRL